jgi:hypothetical protein
MRINILRQKALTNVDKHDPQGKRTQINLYIFVYL